MTQFEYRVITIGDNGRKIFDTADEETLTTIDPGDRHAIVRHFNVLGLDGWQCVGIEGGDNRRALVGNYVFMRSLR